MRPIRPLMTLAALLVACGSDPEPAATQGPAAGSAGVSGSGGSSGAAGQAGGSEAGTAGTSGASSVGSAGTSAGVAGVGGGSSGTSGASGGGQAGTSAGQAGASGEGGSVAGAAGLGGSGGAAGAEQAGGGGQAGDAGAGGAAGAGGSVTKCELPTTLLCDCKSQRSSTARGRWTCPDGATEKVCDCSSAPPVPKDVNLTACADATGIDNQDHKKACDGDTEFPECQVVVSGVAWVGSYCALPINGPNTVDNGGHVFDVRCCKPVKP